MTMATPAKRPRGRPRKAPPGQPVTAPISAMTRTCDYRFPDPPMVAGFDSTRNADGCHWDSAAAERAVRFFPACLTLPDGPGAGCPYHLPEWQAQATALAFGWKRADGARRFREMMVLVPRKNAKTTWLAGLAAYLFLADGERGPQVAVGALDRNQAGILWKIARNMLAPGPLWSKIKEYRNGRMLLPGDPAALFWPVSCEAQNQHGLNLHGAFLDELHTQPNRELYEALTSSMGARRQPLRVLITTADYARESLCNEKVAYARSVRDGLVVDPTFLPILYEATAEEDWHDPAVWRRVNPNYGISLVPGFLEAAHQEAVNQPSQENTFRRLHLNQQTDQDKRWLQMHHWTACQRAVPDAELAGRPCYGGLDLAQTMDISSLVLYWPHCHALRSWFWLPAETIAARPEYRDWHRRGFLCQTPGNVTDFSFIEHQILALSKTHAIKSIAYDRWGAMDMTVRLRETHGVNMLECGQGFASLSTPAKLFERLLISRQLQVTENAVLSWMAGNAAVQADAAGNIKPVKPKGAAKVDGIVAAVMALGAANAAPQAKASPYSTRGILVLGGP